jgi:hypothetical protein
MADSYLVTSPDDADMSLIQDIFNTNDRLQITGHLVDSTAVLNIWKSQNGGSWTRVLPEEFVLEPQDAISPDMFHEVMTYFRNHETGKVFLGNFNNELTYREITDRIGKMVRGF